MTELIKKLREQTGVGVMQIKQALDEADGNEEKALQILKARGLEIVGKKSERATAAGRLESYLHGDPPTIGVLLELLCETDFVARNAEFARLAKELAMQVASMNPVDADDLLKQEYIREQGKSVKDLVGEAIHKFGENIQVGRFIRYKLGE